MSCGRQWHRNKLGKKFSIILPQNHMFSKFDKGPELTSLEEKCAQNGSVLPFSKCYGAQSSPETH